jgi:AbrB family looped-hinge helix DNA binding protein
MAKVRVNHDGWLALPAAIRKRLGLSTGDELELELSDGDIVLRPVRSRSVAGEAAPAPATMAEPSVPSTPSAAAATAPMVKRGPGRPRETPLPAVPPTLKVRGGRRKAAAETGL